MGNCRHALSCPLLLYVVRKVSSISDIRLASLCILWYRFMIFFVCEALHDLGSKLQCSRSALVIARDFQIGIMLMRRMEGGIKSGVLGSFGSTCFPSIMLFCLNLRIHFSFEVIWEWGWLLGVRTQQGSFVIVVILTMEGGGLCSGP